MARPVQRRAMPLRGSIRGADGQVGSSPAISVVSSFSSILLLDWASFAVAARALLRAMKSSRCRRLARIASFGVAVFPPLELNSK